MPRHPAVARGNRPSTPRVILLKAFAQDGTATMAMGAKTPLGALTLGIAILLGACAGSTSGGHCVSHYRRIAEAPHRHALMAELNHRRHVHSTKVVGHHDGKTTVNLLNPNRRVVMQVDIWQVPSGSWRAGQWLQCID